MTDLAPDEKLCPFCAETIKAAAIKCRYCQSELAAVVAARSADDGGAPRWLRSEGRASRNHQPEGDDGGFETVAAQPPQPPSVRPGRLASRVLTAVLGVLALALVVGLVVARDVTGDDGTTSGGVVVSQDARAVALSQASDLTEQTLSYSYKDIDRLRKTGAGRMGATFRKQYDATLDKVIDRTKKFEVTLSAKVVASGVVSISEHEAKVLLFVDQVTTAGARPDQKPTTDLNRVLVTMTRADGDWAIETMDALAQN